MAPISADDVVCYLEENPGFFIEHPDSLRQSGLLTQDSPSAKVLNLRDRLFDRLKGEREDLIRLLDETIEIVRQNEQIEKDFIAIEQLLFEQAPSFASLSEIVKNIESRFGIEYAGFLLLEPTDGIPVIAAKPDESSRIRPLGKIEEELVPMEGGVELKGKLEGGGGPLFPDTLSQDIQSTAVVPLEIHEKKIGFLILVRKTPNDIRKGWRPTSSDASPCVWPWGFPFSSDSTTGNRPKRTPEARHHAAMSLRWLFRPEHAPPWRRVPSPR